MAKETLTPEQEFEKLLEGLTEEQKAELRRISGVNNVGNFDKIPVFKVNTQEDEDKKGKSIKKGNFVIGQSMNNDELEDAGTDLGSTCEGVIFAAPKQYSYYHKDAKKRCISNLIFDSNDVAIGSTLGFKCADKTCPRRQEGIAKEEKCGQQFVVYSQVNGEKVVSYHKKSNYMPMNDHLKALGSYPYMYTTKFKTAKEKNGNVTYYVIVPEKGNPVPSIEMKQNLDLAMETCKGIKAFEQQRETKNKQLAHKPSQSTEGLGFEETKTQTKEGELVFE